MAGTDTHVKRPMSPHLQIYRWRMTMIMSILHRTTGMALFFGIVLVVWWLVAAASGPAAFDVANAVMGSIPGLVILFGASWALVHHMLGGLRHLVWDFGIGLDAPARDRIAVATIIGSVVITVVLWAIGLSLR
jgi:succinate dehydrogenase / fumarate reductase cytochrome b subunit